MSDARFVDVGGAVTIGVDLLGLAQTPIRPVPEPDDDGGGRGGEEEGTASTPTHVTIGVTGCRSR